MSFKKSTIKYHLLSCVQNEAISNPSGYRVSSFCILVSSTSSKEIPSAIQMCDVPHNITKFTPHVILCIIVHRFILENTLLYNLCELTTFCTNTNGIQLEHVLGKHRNHQSHQVNLKVSIASLDASLVTSSTKRV